MELRLIPEFSGGGARDVIGRSGGGHGREADTVGLSGGGQGREAEGRGALRTAFAVGSFAACDRFVTGRLRPGETVDVFLVGLRELAVPFGGLGGGALACAFVTGVMAVLTYEVGEAGRC